MRRLALACLLLAALPASASAATTSARAGSARAGADATGASLGDARIVRTWSTANGGVVTTSLRSGKNGPEWSSASSPDFTLDLNGVATSSTSGWSLRSVKARREPRDPARPDRTRGVQLVFTYGLDPVGLVTLKRIYTLRPGSAVIGVSSTLRNSSPAPIRIASYSLDELTSSKPGVSANVLTYHGGSDWRDDYRVATKEAGDFDDEGEVARFDDGHGAGWFFVSERRSGSMSRAGRSGGRTWIGVDHARDLLDAGPLMSDPPNYNRVDNPAYPVPARARLVPPLGSLRLGRSYLGVYTGGEQGAGAAFTEEFARNEMPRFDRTVGMNSFHPWSHSKDLNGDNLSKQIDLAARLGIEQYMIDDQWQGGPGGESGDWRWDPARFPDRDKNGLPDVVDHMRADHVQLALWMSPLEFHFVGDSGGGDLDAPSQTYEQHPDWACKPTGNVTALAPTDAGLGVWDVTNKDFQDYLSGVIDRLVDDYDVREFKFDFMSWVDCPPHDYLDYEDAFVKLVRRFEANHPDVTFELDETNDQRSWPFESAALGPSWFANAHTHAGSTKQSKLLHDIWTAAPWLPPSSIGFGTYDDTLTGPYSVDYLFPMSMLSHITFWTDLTKLSGDQPEQTAWWIDWYKAHRDDLSGVVYSNTDADPLSGKAWAAFQPWAGDHGYLFAFRQADGPDSQAIRLHGLDGSRSYTVTNVRTGASLGTFPGAELMTSGLPVTLSTPYSAAVLSVDPD